MRRQTLSCTPAFIRLSFHLHHKDKRMKIKPLKLSKRKRSRSSDDADDLAEKKTKNKAEELLRALVKREIEKKKTKKRKAEQYKGKVKKKVSNVDSAEAEQSQEEVTRELPYGRMSISPPPAASSMILVDANDVAFSIHDVPLTAFTLFQISIYERGGQKVSKITILIVTVVWITAGVCVFIVVPTHSWLWLISVFNTIQVVMTVIKYIPQAFMNFFRKRTDGFSIGNNLLDFFGGVKNYGQMTVQSIDQDYLVNFYGNIGKPLLYMVSIFFDILFICQHYILHPRRKHMPLLSSMVDDEATPEEPLVKHSDHSKSEQLV